MDIQEIDKAIGAHGIWKSRLKQAIASGTLDATPAEIRMKDRCAFGKWLHGPSFSASQLASSDYKTAVELHTQFHQVTAKIAEFVMAGKKAEAEKLLAPDAEFARISAQLTTALMNWKKSLSPSLVK